MKWLMIVVALIVVCVGGVIPISGTLAAKGIANPEKSWAPGAVAFAARVRMTMGRYGPAARLWQQAARTWPKSSLHPKALYRYALCMEKGKRSKEAIQAYENYLAMYPKHLWSDQARRRIESLKEMGSD